MLVHGRAKQITLIWFGIVSSFLFFYLSVFDYLENLLLAIIGSGFDKTVAFTAVSIVGLLNIGTTFIGTIIFSLIAYFFGKIFYSNASKKEFLYMCSLVILISTLINIPLAFANFLNMDPDSIVLPNNNLILIVLNPFLIIASVVFYRLLGNTNMTRKVNISFVIVFHVLQIVGNLISRMFLGI